MKFYVLRRKVVSNIKSFISLFKFLIRSFFIKAKPNKIYIDISGIELNRYLYNFIKFFIVNDYTVYLPSNINTIGKLDRNTRGEFKYASWILKEKIKIGKPKKAPNTFFVFKEQISNDFFNLDFSKENFYHIPMSKYPLMYVDENFTFHHNFKNQRKRSVFVSGNFDKERYKIITEQNYFDIPNRRDVVEYIYSKNYYKKLKDELDLTAFLLGNEDNVVLLIDTYYDFSLDLLDLLKTLEKFDFFMALPGIIIPQSHNLTEAMGAGCIPIIHRCYADLFTPPLVHYKTAIVYDEIDELDNLVKECFLLKENEIIFLRNNVIEYYYKNLSPKAVVDKIIYNDFEKIFIQAEHISLNLLKY